MGISWIECVVVLVVILIRVGFGFFSANIMKKKGRSAGAGWALGLCLGVIGLIIAAVLSNKAVGLQQ
jgi:hypothetical protein